jgi:hypothetical protein
MRMLGYGEDSLTLWALQNKLDAILQAPDNASCAQDCTVFYRPSFGRSGGNTSPQFGEFDFIILANTYLYLGESKWARVAKKSDYPTVKLAEPQTTRHRLFEFYVEFWAFGNYATWEEFAAKAPVELQNDGIEKPIAPPGSLLAENLQAILKMIWRHYSSRPETKHVLLYLHRGVDQEKLPQDVNGNANDGKVNFAIVPIDYSEVSVANFIPL